MSARLLARSADTRHAGSQTPMPVTVAPLGCPLHTKPSSGVDGFFQEPPRLDNPVNDTSLQRVIKLFLPRDVKEQISDPLTLFGSLTLSPEILRLNQDAENNVPRTEALDSFGRPKNALITSEGWRALTAISHSEGLVATAYEGRFGSHDRLYQFLKCFLWSPSSGGVTCPAAMQDGAAAVLKRLLETDRLDAASRPVTEKAFARLTTRDPTQAWTSGQWMTERPGGSDVRNTETRATYSADTSKSVASDGSSLGPWSVDGFKWFSSATDADMAVLLAKTDGSDNVSLFFAPVRREAIVPHSAENRLEYNGITIQRLKNKLGTKSLPTAELVLRGTRAYMLGREGQGVKEISTVLNITRVHNAVGAVSAWSRALAVAKAWSRVRKSSGRLLMDTPLHVRGLAKQQVSYHAHTLFTFFTVALLGRSERPSSAHGDQCRAIPDSMGDINRLLRLLTPVLKASTALAGIEGVRFCMESLGGVGYLENTEVELNLAKLYRDTNVLSIWEGTTDVMSADTVRVLAGRDGNAVMDTLKRWVNSAVQRWSGLSNHVVTAAAGLLSTRLDTLTSLLASKSADEVTFHARSILELVCCIVCTVMVMEDALSDGDQVSSKIAERWIKLQTLQNSLLDWKEAALWDRRIVFGYEKAQSKL